MKRWAIALALLLAPQAHAQDAESRVYGAVKTCTGLKAYLRNYSNGRFIADARARVARECPAEPAAPVQRPAPNRAQPQKTVPAPVRTPADPCVQARADWANIATTRDVPVLRAFRDSTPAACAVQRAQAQARINMIETLSNPAASPQERKRAEWNGVPEFEGTWVSADSSNNSGTCFFPWRFEARGGAITWTVAGSTLPIEVVTTSPPSIKWGPQTMTFVGDQIRWRNGVLSCLARRQ